MYVLTDKANMNLNLGMCMAVSKSNEIMNKIHLGFCAGMTILRYSVELCALT